ncbi:MAG: ABC transporter permease subunit, partial [Bacteroidales bacterium]
MFVFMSYTGLLAFGYFHPMVVAALVGLAVALGTEPAAEVETRFLDLVLARPVARRSIVARSVLLVVVTPAIIILAMVLATLVGLRWLTPATIHLRVGLFVGLAVNLWAVVLCAGALALATASIPRRRTTAAGIVTVFLLVAFLVDYLSRVWKPATRVSWLSPFHYFDATAMVMGRPLPTWHIAVLLATAAAAVGLAFALFARRDL